MKVLLRHIHTSTEDGFTLVEVLVATVVGMVVVLAAFSLLEFSTRDVSRITERSHADQAGRVALENIMLQLHSACVAININPIQSGSNSNELKFISETSPLNTNSEPVSSLPSVRLRKLIYTEPTSKTEGTLVEKSWPSKGEAPTYKPFNEAEKPTERLILKGISQTSVSEKPVPIFQYYRYYEEGDSEPKYGQLNPNPIVPSSEATAELVAKVSVSFTLTPEGHESSFAKGDRAVALEDSAILRLATSSESASSSNEPCAQQ
jgi:type II secretory pathway pseudopilin PulG